MLTIETDTMATSVHDPALRARSRRVEYLYQRLTERWTQRQASWGRGAIVHGLPMGSITGIHSVSQMKLQCLGWNDQ